MKQQLREPKEKEIQSQILEWLRWNKVYCWKMNNSAVYIKSKDRYKKSPMRGVADILGIINGGTFLAIEVKAKKGKLSEFQIEFLDNITKNGGIAFCARCLEDVKLLLKPYFI